MLWHPEFPQELPRELLILTGSLTVRPALSVQALVALETLQTLNAPFALRQYRAGDCRSGPISLGSGRGCSFAVSRETAHQWERVRTLLGWVDLIGTMGTALSMF